MDQLQAMRVFVSVAELRSFSGAARALHMSRPAISRAIAVLEDHLGVSLLVRTTRRVVLSQVGQSYLEDCHRILEALQEADASASGSDAVPSGQLRVTAPVMFGRLHVMPVVHRFLQQQAKVEVQLVLLNRIVNLVEEGMDVGVRIGHLRDSAQMAVRVGEVKRLVVCSPGYREAHGEPRGPEALSEHALVSRTHYMERPEWLFSLQGKGDARVSIRARLSTNDVQSAIDAALSGFGLTQALSYQVSQYLQRGALVRVLSDWEPQPLPVHLVYPASKRLPARTRAFLDHAAKELRAQATHWMP